MPIRDRAGVDARTRADLYIPRKRCWKALETGRRKSNDRRANFSPSGRPRPTLRSISLQRRFHRPHIHRGVTVRGRELGRESICRRHRIAKDVTGLAINREKYPTSSFAKDVTAASHRSDGPLAAKCGLENRKDVTDFPSEQHCKDVTKTRAILRALHGTRSESTFAEDVTGPDAPQARSHFEISQKMSRTHRRMKVWHFAYSSAKTAQDVTATIYAEPTVPLQPHCINPSSAEGVCRAAGRPVQ